MPKPRCCREIRARHDGRASRTVAPMTVKRSNDPAAELAHPASLAAALIRAFDGVPRKRVFIALRCGAASASAFIAEGGAGGPNAPREPTPVGCLAKLLTATLAMRLLARQRIGLDTCVVDMLHGGTVARRLAGVTLRHLLEHTHGLDDSLVERPAFRAGFIDVRDLMQSATATPPLAPPGCLYSYGNVGAWLIAGVLERCCARPYAELLRAEVLAPLDIRASSTSTMRADGLGICPASGAGLALTVTDWVRLVASATLDCAQTWPREGDDRPNGAITPLPGWNPLERGIYFGWKYHGHGWFGHQSVWPAASALVRANPQRGIALALISRDHAAPVIAGRVLGTALPELFDLRMPAPLSRMKVFDPERYVGRYGSAAIDAQIARAGNALELRVCDRARGLRQHAALLPAADRTFFTKPPGPESFPYVQFVAAHGEDELGYLWNGRFVLPRL
jgi:CubicO group peptidase (beta-lactamase class C family)